MTQNLCVVNLFSDRFSYMVPTVNTGRLVGTYSDLYLQKLWRVFFSYILEGLSFIHFGGFFFSYLFKVAITAERVNSKTTGGSHFSRDCTRLYSMIDKDCGSLEEHRVVTWAGGVVVSTVQKEAVFMEAWSVSVAFSCPAAGLVW